MGYRAEQEKFDDIFSRVDTIHQCDGRTDPGRQLRPRLRIASRGKNDLVLVKPNLVPFDFDLVKTILFVDTDICRVAYTSLLMIFLFS